MVDDTSADKAPISEPEPTSEGGQPEQLPLSERPAARPRESHSDAAESPTSNPAVTQPESEPPKGWLFGLGCLPLAGIGLGIALLVNLIAYMTGGLTAPSDIQACLDAQNARSIADSAESANDRDVAGLQYAVTKAECEAADGTVP